jgi:cytochrome c oxidase subunit 2
VNGLHSAFDAAGVQAAHILDLWHVIAWTCTAVFAAILAALVLALWRAPRSSPDTPPDLSTVDTPEPGPRRSVTTAVVASTLALLALVVASVFTDRALARMALAGAVNIEVTAHQFWWTARYIDGPEPETFVTANEIHVPVGKPVIVTLKSDDVIHSLWVPSLAGKKDLIPGRTSKMQFRADRPGSYRGQCAEFCGYQHAMMGLLVVAEPQGQWDAWAAAQRQPAPQPADARTTRGRDLFLSQSCAMCHAVQGTPAGAQHGPDLTHLGSRQTLAAGTLPNTPAALATWISQPQHIKPGTNMPATPLSAADLDALVAWLETLR